MVKTMVEVCRVPIPRLRQSRLAKVRAKVPEEEVPISADIGARKQDAALENSADSTIRCWLMLHLDAGCVRRVFIEKMNVHIDPECS